MLQCACSRSGAFPIRTSPDDNQPVCADACGEAFLPRSSLILIELICGLAGLPVRLAQSPEPLVGHAAWSLWPHAYRLRDHEGQLVRRFNQLGPESVVRRASTPPHPNTVSAVCEDVSRRYPPAAFFISNHWLPPPDMGLQQLPYSVVVSNNEWTPANRFPRKLR